MHHFRTFSWFCFIWVLGGCDIVEHTTTRPTKVLPTRQTQLYDCWFRTKLSISVDFSLARNMTFLPASPMFNLVLVPMQKRWLTLRRGTPLTPYGPVTSKSPLSNCFKKTARRPRKRPARRITTDPGVMFFLVKIDPSWPLTTQPFLWNTIKIGHLIPIEDFVTFPYICHILRGRGRREGEGGGPAPPE